MRAVLLLKTFKYDFFNCECHNYYINDYRDDHISLCNRKRRLSMVQSCLLLPFPKLVRKAAKVRAVI